MNGPAAVILAFVISIQMIPNIERETDIDTFDSDLSDIPVTSWPDGFGPDDYGDIAVDHRGPDVFEVVYSTRRAENHGFTWGGTDSDLVLVMVDSDLHPQINSSLQGYVKDLEITGYSVTVINGSWSSAVAVRTLLNDTLDEGLVGAVLIGDVIEAWYEMDNPSPWGHEEFPIDYYYMDLDGIWGDADTDGKFDSHTGNPDPEIWVGRLKPSILGNEIGDMENYLDKNRGYKNGSLTLPHNSLVYIDDDWAPWATSWNNSAALAYDNGTLVYDGATTIHTDYESRLAQDHESVLLAAHSHPTGHVFKIGSQYTGGSTTTAEIKSIDPHSHFYNLFCCSGCRYTSTNNIGTQYVFADSYGLMAVGSTKTGSMLNFDPYYRPLGNNESFGEAFKNWMKVQAENDPKWFYGMTILGDPTLTTIHDVTVTAPEVWSPTHPDQEMCYSDNDPLLNWTGPEDLSGISGYYYRLDAVPDTVPDNGSDTFTTDMSIGFTDLADGTWYFHIIAEDTVGNIGSEPAHFRIDIDTIPPNGSIMINSGKEVTVNRTVSLNISGTDANGIEFMRFSEDKLNWTEWESFNQTAEINLSEEDDLKTIYLELMDRANLTNIDDIFDSIYLDTTSPNGNVSLNGGEMYTTNRTVEYEIDSVDLSGIMSMRMRIPGNLWSPWEDYESTGIITFSPVDGEKEIQVMLMDMGGLISTNNITDTIILDTTPPEGTITINGGSVYTSDTHVNIDISLTDNNPVSDVRLKNETGEWGVWRNITEGMAFDLEPINGIRTVYAEVRDDAGLVSDDMIMDSIRLDTVPPNGSFLIMGGEKYTTSPNVTLNLRGEDRWEVAWVGISNDGINWSTWMDYDEEIDHVLSGGDGEKMVFVRFMDGAGLISPLYNDTIILDTTAPEGSLSLMDGDGYYLSNEIGTFRISSSEEIQLFRSRVNDEGWTGWRSFDINQEIPLGEEGSKIVSVQLMDRGGINSANITINCFVDTSAPEMTLSVDEFTWYGEYDPDMASAHFRSPDPGSPLSGYYLSYQDGRDTEYHDLHGMRSHDGIVDLNWSLIPEGRSGIAMGVIDTAGNEIVSTFYILKDTSDPVITVIEDDLEVDGGRVRIRFAPADPTSEIESMVVIIDEGDPVQVNEAPDQDGVVTYTIEDLDPGAHTIRIVVTDHAGNTVEEVIEVDVPGDGIPILPIIIGISILLLILLGIAGFLLFRRSGGESWDEE